MQSRRLTFLCAIFFKLLLLNLSIASWAQSEDEFLFSSGEEYKKIRVVRVLSTDTIELENKEKIKLIGLRAPEPPIKKKIERDGHGFIIKEKEPWTPLNQKALEYLQALLEGQFVRVEFDIVKKSENYETLAYVYRLQDNLFVNEDILRQGYAYLQIQPPNLREAQILRDAYREAKQEKRGLQAE